MKPEEGGRKMGEGDGEMEGRDEGMGTREGLYRSYL